MGLAGSVHCVAMCGATSAAAVGACGGARPLPSWLGFHLGRLLGYAAAGAVAAGSVSALATLGQRSPAFRPIWLMAHLGLLALGLFLVWQGRQPAWLARLGRQGPRTAQASATGWQVIRGPIQSAAAGTAWVAWPCGLLQSALLVAALANGPLGGAAVMAAFALGSALALGLGSVWWLRFSRAQGPSGWGARADVWVTRLSGAALAAASAWALGHGVWTRFLAWCAT
jgi:sulfite exporter TauE/SafE